MVFYVDPDPHGVGGEHVGVCVPGEHVVGLHQDVYHHNGVLQHHWVQGHHGLTTCPSAMCVEAKVEAILPCNDLYRLG